MDLFLMDLILKGTVNPKSKVLDVGCGEGRNGVHFIQNGFEYNGWDTDKSKLRLIEYVAKSFKGSKTNFKLIDLREATSNDQFDLIICSRVLHFAQSKDDFYTMWNKLVSLLGEEGILYISMDSIVDVSIGKELENGQVEFPDRKVRFALTKELYQEIKKGFVEIEPLRTLVHHDSRAQSFICLKKA